MATSGGNSNGFVYVPPILINDIHKSMLYVANCTYRNLTDPYHYALCKVNTLYV